jgi:predicted aldo/keto reductase-like oxidoreductase
LSDDYFASYAGKPEALKREEEPANALAARLQRSRGSRLTREIISPMWTKPYGKTGKNISVIGFGAMRFANPADLDASAAVVRHAHARGINYFDTAPYYCDDRSEEIMGRAFQTMPRDSYYVSTKCSEADGDALRASLKRSIKRLGVDSIDFFHIWCLLRPEQLDERLKGGAIAAAQQAKAEGLIKHLVVSSHLNGEDNASVLKSGLFEGITVGYNAINFPFRAKTLEAAAKHNLGVATMNPLGGGLIPRNAARLTFLKGPQDQDVVQAALRFNISQPAITSALVGFANEREVDEAVAAVENFQPYPADHIERIKGSIGASFEGFCTGCGYCIPCPVNVEIPKLMDTFNQKILNGTDDAMRDRLKWHWSLSPDVAAACTECGTCEDACTQHLPIRARLHEIAALAQGQPKG